MLGRSGRAVGWGVPYLLLADQRSWASCAEAWFELLLVRCSGGGTSFEFWCRRRNVADYIPNLYRFITVYTAALPYERQ